MIHSYLMQLYTHHTSHTATWRRWGMAALTVAVLTLGAVPLLGSPGAHAQGAVPAAQVASVNINKADAETLAAGLKGVGLSRARDIIRYREAYGPFESVDELTEVKGVGLATLERNRAVITLE